jgi:condensin complex subunit 1
LASFAYNDKALKKLMENFSCYSDKLQEDKVYEAFNTIIAQSKKLPKTENKVILDELSTKIEEERAKQV